MSSNDNSKEYRFRVKKERISSPSEERIKEVSQKSIFEFKYMKAYRTMCIRFRAIPHIAKCVFVVLTKFFGIQFLEKKHILKIPVTHVDHELDDRVPFEPERVNIYLDFVNLWVRPVTMLIERYGRHKCVPLIIEWLKYLTLTYSSAAEIYTRNMSTTYRPDYEETKQFKLIHKTDPHFHCVPSLHIAIVCLCFSFYRMIFEREGFTDYEKEKWLNELYNQATCIAETVLYIKQHSVNCIPAALYMLTQIIPDLFTKQDALTFIDDLFVDSCAIEHEDIMKIKTHIHTLFEKFYSEGQTSENWYTPVLNWLSTYQSSK